MRPIGSAALDCSEAVPECIGIAWGSALSLLLSGHKLPVYFWFFLVLTAVWTGVRVISAAFVLSQSI
jgi:hypothetical protein